MVQRLPGWFRGVFVAVMLITCCVTCWYASEQYSLRFQIADLSLSLETSRGRETKQTYEYEQVVTELPLIQAQVAEMEPKAAAAKEEEQALRAQRKALRAEKKDVDAQLEALQADVKALEETRDALQKDVEALRIQEKALLEQLK